MKLRLKCDACGIIVHSDSVEPLLVHRATAENWLCQQTMICLRGGYFFASRFHKTGDIEFPGDSVLDANLEELPVKRDGGEDGVPHYNVVFATPGRSFIPEYVESLLECVKWLESQGLSYHFASKYSSLVSSARELTALDSYDQDYSVREFGAGKFTYDRVLWIDSDISWTLDAFVRLYESDEDIISGLYQTHPNGTLALAFDDGEGRPRTVNKVELLLWDEPVEAWGVGFGFVMVKWGVFETMARPWFLMERIVWPAVGYETNIGEDYSWCMNARKAGYRVMVDPLCKVWHHKDTIYVVE